MKGFCPQETGIQSLFLKDNQNKIGSLVPTVPEFLRLDIKGWSEFCVI